MEWFMTVGCIVLLFALISAFAGAPEKELGQDGSGELFPSKEDDSWSLGETSVWGDPDNSTGSYVSNCSCSDDLIVNPANGNLMMGGIGGIDTSGNVYGFDGSHDYSTSGFDDSFSSSLDSCSSSNFSD